MVGGCGICGCQRETAHVIATYDLDVDETRGQHLVRRAREDPDFRERLLENPRQTLSEVYGAELPEDVMVHVHEEDSNNLHVVLPSHDLAIPDLDDVAGGWGGCSTEWFQRRHEQAPQGQTRPGLFGDTE